VDIWGDDTRCLDPLDPVSSDGTATGPAPDPDQAWSLAGGDIHDQTLLPWPERPTDVAEVSLDPCSDPIGTSVESWPFPEDPSSHTIFALAGNVAEWTSDAFQPYDYVDATGTGCWVKPNATVLDMADRQPTGEWCAPEQPVGAYTTFSTRGGSWREPVDAAWSAGRGSAPNVPPVARPDIGFRCVKDF